MAESYELNAVPKARGTRFVDVWYKPGVMDPAGQSVLKAAMDLGVKNLAAASCGTRFVFDGEVPASAAKELLNPMIQERSEALA